MKKLALASLVSVLSTTVFAEPVVYGKANMSFQSVNEGDESFTELTSNNSRLGVKGNLDLEDGLKAIYQVELGVNFDDGDSGGRTVTQRNIFIGLQGNFGTVKAGKFDSPMKVSQKKIDLFNDLEGDIKNVITGNDQRPSNIISYTSKDAPVVANVAYISAEDETLDDGVSASVAFGQENLYLALAYDTNVAAQDLNVIRVVGQYNIGGFQLGALYEEADQDIEGVDTEAADGWLVSAAYKMDKWVWKLQTGESDQKYVGGETASIGFDYKLAKPVTLYGYFTANEDENTLDNDYVGVGAIVKF